LRDNWADARSNGPLNYCAARGATVSPNHRDRKGSQLILPGGSQPEDEMPGLDEQIVEMVSQQALQLVATNIAVAALAGEVAKLSGDAPAFAERLKKSSLAILAAMPMPGDEPELISMFRDSVRDNLALIFEMIRSADRE
jgi:hypothetical protein